MMFFEIQNFLPPCSLGRHFESLINFCHLDEPMLKASESHAMESTVRLDTSKKETADFCQFQQNIPAKISVVSIQMCEVSIELCLGSNEVF